MCYQENFFQRWMTKKAQRRENVEMVKHDRRKQPTQPTLAPVTARDPKKSRDVERDVEAA